LLAPAPRLGGRVAARPAAELDARPAPPIAVRLIDRTYGHLARDSEQAIRARLDARAERSGVVVASEPE
jgi:hypothetical protein